jgi:hypothetical protein
MFEVFQPHKNQRPNDSVRRSLDNLANLLRPILSSKPNTCDLGYSSHFLQALPALSLQQKLLQKNYPRMGLLKGYFERVMK